MAEQSRRPKQAPGPLGSVLTMDDLPPPSAKRWIAHREAAIVPSEAHSISIFRGPAHLLTVPARDAPRRLGAKALLQIGLPTICID